MKKLLILLLVSLSFALTPTPRKYLGIGTARQATLADSGCVLYMAIGDSIAKCLTVAKFNALVKADSVALAKADSTLRAIDSTARALLAPRANPTFTGLVKFDTLKTTVKPDSTRYVCVDTSVHLFTQRAACH